MKFLTAVGVALLLSSPVLAHDLRVFASVMGAEVRVEAKFSSGRTPNSGEVRVKDAAGATIMTLPIGEGGVATFALPEAAKAGGLMIEVKAGDGHEDYWLLTPADIAAGQGSE